jgi:hypothetical protein
VPDVVANAGSLKELAVAVRVADRGDVFTRNLETVAERLEPVALVFGPEVVDRAIAVQSCPGREVRS